MPAEADMVVPAFVVLIPARLASTRLPDKPLADIGGAPMVVRVAQAARRSAATRVVVLADDARIVQACGAHGVEAFATRVDHASGTDRLAEGCARLGLVDETVVVNVQGDEPQIEPDAIERCAALLARDAECAIATLAHPMGNAGGFTDPNVVKVVRDARGRALYFSRAPIPWPRDAHEPPVPEGTPLRHVGLYAYRAGFLRRFPNLSEAPIERVEKLEQLRAMWHGERIAVGIIERPLPAGVDTPADLERVRAAWGRDGPA